MNTRTFLFSLLAIFVCTNIHARLRINGQEINTLITPDQMICIRTQADDGTIISCTGIAAKGNNENIALNFWQPYEPYKLQDAIAKILSLKEQSINLQSNKLHMSSDTTFNITQQYYVGYEEILLKAGITLFLEDSLLQSSDIIYLVANANVIFNNCVVIDTPQVQIETYLPSSIYSAIVITKDPENKFPLTLSGMVDFEDSTIDLLCIGAKEIKIHFTQEAFK
jgi:hypothetical protein